MSNSLRAFDRSAVQLSGGLFEHRWNLVRNYLLSLKNDDLLLPFRLEAGYGVWPGTTNPEDGHSGWEAATCQLRGHFLGHWLSGAAQIIASNGDTELKVKADAIVRELANCQKLNGGTWVGSTPEKYLGWLAEGRWLWAPQYVHHKTFMGLYDMYAFAGNEQALEVADKFADWFHNWTKAFTREQMDTILDAETGGMLEAFANLYGVKKSQKYLDLIERYTRGRLFDPLLAGQDVLTNMHANTTIPEAHGAARCYEVTGDERWRKIVEAYWKCAVTDRGAFCTGGQTTGEMWNPPFKLANRRTDKTQEHCAVYNMIRLADYLYRWTGEAQYLDYIERNLYNGILAQQNPNTGMVAYYLPFVPGATKKWGHRTHDFWCCHGSLVQVHPMMRSLIYFQDEQAITVAQYIPSRVKAEMAGAKVELSQWLDSQAGNMQCLLPNEGAWNKPAERPESWHIGMSVKADKPTTFTLKLRLPEWVVGKPTLVVNGKKVAAAKLADGYLVIKREWSDDKLELDFPKALRAEALPDEKGTVAFLDGPVVLAGVIDHEPQLVGDARKPETILAVDGERAWSSWLPLWRTIGQQRNIKFKPLFEIADEQYTIYFPVVKK